MLGLRALMMRYPSGLLPTHRWPTSLYVVTEWIDLQAEARCTFLDREHQRACKEPPGFNCMCGLHVCGNLSTLMRYVLRTGLEFTALVDMWGKIVEHDEGWRAQYAKVVAAVVELGPSLVPIIEARRDPRDYLHVWLIQARQHEEQHAEALVKHDACAYTAAEKWDLPVLTLETALEIVEADHEYWEEETSYPTGEAYNPTTYPH